MRTRQSPPAAGYVLLLAMILLAVLTVLGVAAVSVASRERENAANKSKYDRVVGCARAAQAQIFAEVAAYGTGYLTGTQGVRSITLVGEGTERTELAAPAHYGTAVDGTVAVNSLVLAMPAGAGGAQLAVASDRTNSGGATLPPGQPLRVVARCTDAFNRQFEVELAIRFAF